MIFIKTQQLSRDLTRIDMCVKKNSFTNLIRMGKFAEKYLVHKIVLQTPEKSEPVLADKEVISDPEKIMRSYQIQKKSELLSM